MLQFHPDNLGNRHRCQLAYTNRLGVDLTVMNTVAEVLCHTETVPEDLLYSDRSRRLLTLITGGYAETLDGSRPRISAQIRSDHRFRLTEKGRQALQSAAAKPFAAVGETISSSLREDHGISFEQRQMFRQILDQETAERRVQSSPAQPSPSQSQDPVDKTRQALEEQLARGPS